MSTRPNTFGSKSLFVVPAGLVRILDRELLAAGIQKRDERGRTIDVHALRTSIGTLLSKGGVAPRTAQAAMRHSKIDLTMGVYIDPKLLDVYGALDSLPSLNLAIDRTPDDASNRDGHPRRCDRLRTCRHEVCTSVCTKHWPTGAICVVCCHLIGC